MLIITLRLIGAESEQGAICWSSGGIVFFFLLKMFLFEGRILVYSYKILVIVWISTLMFFLILFIYNKWNKLHYFTKRENSCVINKIYESPDLIFRCSECFLLGVDWYKKNEQLHSIKTGLFFSTRMLVCPFNNTYKYSFFLSSVSLIGLFSNLKRIPLCL